MPTMRVVDADKLASTIKRLKESAQPKPEAMQDNAYLKIYWNSIDAALSIVLESVKSASVMVEVK